MASKRDEVILKCSICGDENYITTRNKRSHPNKMEIMIAFLSSIGDSIVAIKQGTIVKIHVHTKVPYQAIEYAQRYGEFITFKMENMSIQHNEVLLKEITGDTKKPEVIKPVTTPKKRVPLAIIAVSPSEAISTLFKEMGVSEIISGGQTMNPSAQDFIDAFKRANADSLIVFPNNGNVILTAQQAAKMYKDSQILIIPSKSVVEAYSALSMADPINETLEENIASMKESMANLVAAEVCPAVRDSVNNGVAIKKGDFIGIMVYIACPPLYRVYKKSDPAHKFLYAWDDQSLEDAKTKIGAGYGINRYKGLGEMNADQLANTTMNKKTRQLLQVHIDDPLVVEKRIGILMGQDPSLRRDWIEENISFNVEDTFIKEVKK